jgi:hypothetical protein
MRFGGRGRRVARGALGLLCLGGLPFKDLQDAVQCTAGLAGVFRLTRRSCVLAAGAPRHLARHPNIKYTNFSTPHLYKNQIIEGYNYSR